MRGSGILATERLSIRSIVASKIRTSKLIQSAASRSSPLSSIEFGATLNLLREFEMKLKRWLFAPYHFRAGTDSPFYGAAIVIPLISGEIAWLGACRFMR